MSTVTVDRFIETSSVASAHKLYGGWYMGAGQAFTAYPTYLTSVKFYLKKVATPTGKGYAALYSKTGTYGSTAKPLAVLATSADFDISSVSATDYMLESFTFTSKPELGFSQYVVGLRLYGDGTVDATSYILMAKNLCPTPDAIALHPGNSFIYDTAHSYVSQTAGNDIVFYAYGDDSIQVSNPAKQGGRCIYTNATKHSADEILKKSAQAIKGAKAAMVAQMVKNARIAQRDRIMNQKKIKSLR